MPGYDTVYYIHKTFFARGPALLAMPKKAGLTLQVMLILVVYYIFSGKTSNGMVSGRFA
jgi:hypothetical protein